MGVWDLSARELLERTASDAPTPGGGSVSAVTGALGLGLVVMALEISARHKNAAPDLPDLLERARTLLARLPAHADADVRAFEGYMAALALRKASDGEREARRAAMQAAARAASDAPLASARDLLGGLILAREAAPLSHAHVVSDVGAGAELLLGALRASLLTVDINLGALPDAEAAALRAARQDVQVRAEALHAEAVQRVSTRMR